MLLFQLFVNVGMTVGIMPITGVPAPLLSYGGSSMLVTFLALGLLQSINAQARETGMRPRAGRYRLRMRDPCLKKQVLVTVDREETRVAILEAAGRAAPAAVARRRGGLPDGLPRRGDLLRAARQPLDRRQHLQGRRRQRPARARGGVRRHRPRQERLPARRRDRAPRRGARAARPRQRQGARRSPTCSSPGQEIVVQVIKDPLKTKGARLTMEVTIAGRYMVYAPTGEGVGVSRRLEDKERQRLRKEASQLDLGGGGAIIRTAAHGAKREDFERELQYLFKLNEVLQKRVKETKAPAHGLPGGRPLRPRRARHLLRALRARGRRRPQAAPPAGLLLRPHGARAGRPRRAVGVPTSRVRGLRRRGRHRGHAREARRPARAAAT